MSLTNKIFIAMGLGLIVGLALNVIIQPETEPVAGSLSQWLQVFVVNGLLDTVGQIFVASLKLLVVPMVFVSLVCGAASLGGHSRMGALAGKTLSLYLLTTAIAIAIAMFFATLVGPGKGIDLAAAGSFTPTDAPSLKDTLIGIFPTNPFKAMVEGNMLQVIVFALLFGIALSRSGTEISRNLASFFENLNSVILTLVMMLMQLAPYGVFCLLAKLFSVLGIGSIMNLATYFLTVVVVLLLHAFGVYGFLLKLFTGLNPATFFRKMWKVAVFGFSTSSSNATLPINLRTVEHDLGVHKQVASFSIPLGATINMDGTAIMQGVATVFIAQAYQIDIGLTGYLLVILSATLASVGTAGVPGVGLITLAMVLEQVGLPVEGIALIIGVDRLLDMIRTAVNLTGDAMVSVVVAKSEGKLDEAIFNNPNVNAENDPVEPVA